MIFSPLITDFSVKELTSQYMIHVPAFSAHTVQETRMHIKTHGRYVRSLPGMESHAAYLTFSGGNRRKSTDSMFHYNAPFVKRMSNPGEYKIILTKFSIPAFGGPALAEHFRMHDQLAIL